MTNTFNLRNRISLHKQFVILILLLSSSKIFTQIDVHIQNATIGNGCSDGAITATISGGIQPYEYNWWSPDIPNFQRTTKDIANLQEAKYCLIVEDALCGSIEGCWDVECDRSLKIIVEEIQNPKQCFNHGGCNGSIEISLQGSGSYTFFWRGFNTGFTANTQNVSNLCPDDYLLRVTDLITNKVATKNFNLCCCSSIAGDPDPSPNNYTLCDPNGPPHPINQIIGDLGHCTNSTSKDGYIDISVSGGLRPLHYLWTGPNNFKSNNEDISNLYPGRYCVKVMDGCDDMTECFDIVDCEEEEFEFDVEIIPPCGRNDLRWANYHYNL